MHAAFGNRPKRAHVFADVFFIEDFRCCAEFLGFGFGSFGEVLRGADIGGGIAEVFAQVDAVEGGFGGGYGRLNGSGVFEGVKSGALQLGGFGFFFEAVETVNRRADGEGERFGGRRGFGGIQCGQVDGNAFLLLRPGSGFGGGFFEFGAGEGSRAADGNSAQFALGHSLRGGKGFAVFQRSKQQGGGFACGGGDGFADNIKRRACGLRLQSIGFCDKFHLPISLSVAVEKPSDCNPHAGRLKPPPRLSDGLCR